MYKTVHRNIHHHKPEDHLDVAKFQPYRKTGTLGEFIYSTKANDEPVTPGVSNLRPGVLNGLGKALENMKEACMLMVIYTTPK